MHHLLSRSVLWRGHRETVAKLFLGLTPRHGWCRINWLRFKNPPMGWERHLLWRRQPRSVPSHLLCTLRLHFFLAAYMFGVVVYLTVTVNSLRTIVNPVENVDSREDQIEAMRILSAGNVIIVACLGLILALQVSAFSLILFVPSHRKLPLRPDRNGWGVLRRMLRSRRRDETTLRI